MHTIKEFFPELLKSVDLIIADATRLPFRNDSFNVSVSYSAIEHASPPLRRYWMSEMARVTKMGGSVVATLQNKLSLVCYLFLPFRVNNLNALVTLSDEVKRKAPELHGLNKNKIVVIPLRVSKYILKL